MYPWFSSVKYQNIFLLQRDNSTITVYNLNYQNLIRTKLIMFHVSKKNKKKRIYIPLKKNIHSLLPLHFVPNLTLICRCAGHCQMLKLYLIIYVTTKKKKK